MIEIKTEALVKPLSDDSNLTTVYNKFKANVMSIKYSYRDLKQSIYDGKKNAVKEYFAKYDRNYKLIKLSKLDPELVEEYEKIRNGFEEFEKSIQFILNYVKIGESQEIAVKKLAKMTKTAKYFSLAQWKYTGEYFAPMSEEEILKEINHFDGLLRLFGANIFCVEFKNGKVENIYF